MMMRFPLRPNHEDHDTKGNKTVQRLGKALCKLSRLDYLLLSLVELGVLVSKIALECMSSNQAFCNLVLHDDNAYYMLYMYNLCRNLFSACLCQI